MLLVSSCSCLCPIQWSQLLSREWRCSLSSADRRCSNYIWVIDHLIAYWGVSYIRDLTVVCIPPGAETGLFWGKLAGCNCCWCPGSLRRQTWYQLCTINWPLTSTTKDVNLHPASAACIRHWIGPALIQIMACRLFGAKPLSKPMLGYC